MMPSETLNKSLRPAVLSQRLIWVAMTLSMLLVPVVVGVMNSAKHGGVISVSNGVRVGLVVLALVAVIVSFLAHRFLLSAKRIRSTRDNPDPRKLATNPKTHDVNEARLAEIKLMNPTETKTLALARQYQSALIIRLALNEVVMLAGVMLAVLEQRFESVVPFALAAIVLNLLAYPRFSKLVEENIARMPQFE